MQKLVIIGAGGFARETLDVVDAINAQKPQYDMLGFIADPDYAAAGTILNDKPILGGFDWLADAQQADNAAIQVVCGVGAPQHRHKLIQRAQATGATFATLIHPNALLTRWVQVGPGSIITAGCVLTNQIVIGQHVHVNLDCTLGHDVVLHDYATLAPGVHVSGNVTLEQGVYVGTGANLIEKLTVGRWSIVGAGSTVTKDIPANTTAVGVPAKVIKQRDEGWHLI